MTTTQIAGDVWFESHNGSSFSPICHFMFSYAACLLWLMYDANNFCLQITVGPSFVHIRDVNTNVTTLIEGTTRQFQCRTSSSNPRSHIVWKLNGQIFPADIDPLEEPGEYSGTIVQLSKTLGLGKPLKEYHTKILSCEASNPETGHIVTDSTQLNIICS